MTAFDSACLPLGTRLDDQYVIRDVLGRGGFAITYVIRDELLDREFALKEFFPDELVRRDDATTQVIVRPNRANDYEWGRKKFFDEARLLAQFNHPNIVGVRRVFQANGTAYMILDLVRGITLEAWLRSLDSPPTQTELDLITGPLLSALLLVHTNRTWHLDISPDNIMIRSGDGTPVLLDFGASRLAIKQKTQLSALVFKSGYSAPEQYTSKSDQYGAWTDIYAFGATLYRAVSGACPAEATARQMLDDLAPASDLSRGRYRRSFLAGIDQSLRLVPAQRPQSIEGWSRQLLEGSQSSNRLFEARAPVARAATKKVDVEKSAEPSYVAPAARTHSAFWSIAAASAFSLVALAIGVAVGFHLGTGQMPWRATNPIAQPANEPAPDSAAREAEARERPDEQQRGKDREDREATASKHPFTGRWGNSDAACDRSTWSYGSGDRLIIFGFEMAQYMAAEGFNSSTCNFAKISSEKDQATFTAVCGNGNALTLKQSGTTLSGYGPDRQFLELSKCP